jgi:antirestriction protein ArdC
MTEAVETLRTSDGWLEWLEVAAKFHRYSLGNMMLIASQRPDATQVSGYNRWRELGRQVRKGERGIAILAPCHRKVRDQETDEERYILAGFRVVHVFDVAQTEGEPLPADPTQAYAAERRQVLGEYKHVLEVADRCGYAIQVEPAAGAQGPFGWFQRGTSVLHVADDCEGAMAKTALHELSHALDPALGDDRQLNELVAESACWLAGQLLGIDTSIPSTTYLAGWGLDKNRAQAIAERVLAVVSRVEETLQ